MHRKLVECICKNSIITFSVAYSIPFLPRLFLPCTEMRLFCSGVRNQGQGVGWAKKKNIIYRNYSVSCGICGRQSDVPAGFSSSTLSSLFIHSSPLYHAHLPSSSWCGIGLTGRHSVYLGRQLGVLFTGMRIRFFQEHNIQAKTFVLFEIKESSSENITATVCFVAIHFNNLYIRIFNKGTKFNKCTDNSIHTGDWLSVERMQTKTNNCVRKEAVLK